MTRLDKILLASALLLAVLLVAWALSAAAADEAAPATAYRCLQPDGTIAYGWLDEPLEGGAAVAPPCLMRGVLDGPIHVWTPNGRAQIKPAPSVPVRREGVVELEDRRAVATLPPDATSWDAPSEYVQPGGCLQVVAFSLDEEGNEYESEPATLCFE